MGEVSLSEHPALLLIPFGLVFLFVAIWLLVVTILGVASGWSRLAKAYPDRAETPLLRLKGQSGTVGPVINFRGVLGLTVCPSGLRVGVARIIGPWSKDFLVPWREISLSREKVLFVQLVRLRFGDPPTGELTLRAKTAERLAEAAGGNWPEAR